MAIDTRDKRASAIHVGVPWRGLLPLPDGTINQPDRQHAGLFYRGVTAAHPFHLPVMARTFVEFVSPITEVDSLTGETFVEFEG